jgi:hypothetical protein
VRFGTSDPDAVDQDADLLDLHAEQALHCPTHGIADSPTRGGEVRAWSGDDSQAHDDAIGSDSNEDRRACERCTPAWAASSDPKDLGHLKRGQPSDLDDHAAAHGQIRGEIHGPVASFLVGRVVRQFLNEFDL